MKKFGPKTEKIFYFLAAYSILSIPFQHPVWFRNTLIIVWAIIGICWLIIGIANLFIWFFNRKIQALEKRKEKLLAEREQLNQKLFEKFGNYTNDYGYGKDQNV